MNAKTRRKHRSDELSLGETKANARIAGYLFAETNSGQSCNGV